MSIDQSKRFQDTRKKLPIITPDIEIGYLALLNKYYIFKKTPQADAALSSFLQDNGLVDVQINFPDLFVITAQPVDAAMKQAEDDFLRKTRRGPYAQLQPDVKGASDDNSSSDDIMKNLIEVGKAIVNSPNLTEGEPDNATPSAETNSQGQNTPTGNTSSIDAIFNEVANKVGVPAALPKAVMQKECNAIFSLSSEEITQFSLPGQGISPTHNAVGPCYDNNYVPGHCCWGPMQFYDTTWTENATAVNEFGGYSHTPNVENIRDSVYGAAKKLKHDGGGGDVNNWTKDQFFLAFRSYYGACGDSIDPHYCDDAWQNYQNNKASSPAE